MTCVHAAVVDKHGKIVERLFEAGASPNEASSTGELPLQNAVLHGSLGLVKLLLSAGADPDKPDVTLPTEFDTPYRDLLTMSKYRRMPLEMFSELLDAGVNPSKINKWGLSVWSEVM